MLPAIVIGGWLGAGKTTLVNRLLRAADGRRIAVLVNDFGDVGIDADLVESREESVMNLAGGCVCCAIGNDLLEALIALPARATPFDLVLIETSGVALPGSVARAARLARGIVVDGTVVLVDAESIRARAADRHVGDIVTRQLAEADLLVLNKVDLVPADELPALRAWLRDAVPSTPVVEVAEAAVPPELVLGLRDAAGSRPERTGSMFTGSIQPAPAAARMTTTTLPLDGAFDLAALATSLADPVLGILRAKAMLRDASGRRAVLHAVGTRVRTGPAPAASAAAAGDAPARLVAIGLHDSLDPQRITERVDAARLPARQPVRSPG